MYISEFLCGVLCTFTVLFILLVGAIIVCALNTNDKDKNDKR